MNQIEAEMVHWQLTFKPNPDVLEQMTIGYVSKPDKSLSQILTFWM